MADFEWSWPKAIDRPLVEQILTLDFLAIEQVRFGDRLGVAHTVSPAAARCLLLPMIVQPLVENAVKRGIGSLTAGGVVRIEAERRGSQLCLVVANDVDVGGHEGAPGRGMGLANVRQRLLAAYGEQAALHWGLRDGVFRVELTMPAQEQEHEHGPQHDGAMEAACA